MEISMKLRKEEANINLQYTLPTVLGIIKAFYVQHIPNHCKIGGFFKWLRLKLVHRNDFHLFFGSEGPNAVRVTCC